MFGSVWLCLALVWTKWCHIMFDQHWPRRGWCSSTWEKYSNQKTKGQTTNTCCIVLVLSGLSWMFNCLSNMLGRRPIGFKVFNTWNSWQLGYPFRFGDNIRKSSPWQRKIHVFVRWCSVLKTSVVNHLRRCRNTPKKQLHPETVSVSVFGAVGIYF